MEKEKNLDYWKKNAEEDYMQVPISVLRYITELESRVEALSQHDVSGRSEQFVCEHLHRTEYAHLGKYKCEDCGKWMDKQTNFH